MSDIAIKVNGLTKIYKLYEKPVDRLKESLGLSKKVYHTEHYALNNINFEVKKGETVGIIGTNGSGKSTLLKIITGVLHPTLGEMEVKGKISALLELGAGFNPEYTGIENIFLNGTMAGYSKEVIESRVQQIVEFAEIGEFIHQPVKMYSSGMFARLAFAVAINIEPDILIVDEALSVGDITFQNKCFRKFEEMKNKGTTILFVSHDLNSVKQMCSRVLWIEKGQQKMFGDNEEVCGAYIDQQRMCINQQVQLENDYSSIKKVDILQEKKTEAYFPKIKKDGDRFKSNQVDILSCFVKDSQGNITKEIKVDQECTFHIVVEFLQKIENSIVGISIENNKSLPIFGLNNYMQSDSVISGEAGDILEVIYKIKLPRFMKGYYTLNPAVAAGTQQEHIMLTWLHGADVIYIDNNGYNDSLIEVPSKIQIKNFKESEIKIYEVE